MQALQHISTSPTLAMNQHVKEMERGGRVVYKFGFGESPFTPPAAVISALSHSSAETYYGDTQGELVLRERIADFHAEVFGIEAAAERIFVAPGSKILLFNIMACFQEADVLIPAPAWVSYAPQAKIAGLNSIAIGTGFLARWRITPETIRAALRQKKKKQSILILNQPGNPDGLNYTSQELEAIAEVCRQEKILIISDEIYALLSHSSPFHSISKVYPEATITTTGMSKWCGAGGWRMGVALLSEGISDDFFQTLKGVCSETYSCTSTPIQMAAAEAYRSYAEILPFIASQNAILKTIGGRIHKDLDGAFIRLHAPEGGFYLFPDFSPMKDALLQQGIKDSIGLCTRILEDSGVALLPGAAFGTAPDMLCARLAYVDMKVPENLADFNIQEHAAHMMEGIGALLDWCEQKA